MHATAPAWAYGALPARLAEPLAGKVVIATINYFPKRDGHIADIDNGTTTAPGILQAHLPASKVVRAFSMIDAADMSGDGHPKGDPKRRALARARRSSRSWIFPIRIRDPAWCRALLLR